MLKSKEITPEMVRAGYDALADAILFAPVVFDEPEVPDLNALAEAVYTAMEHARCRPATSAREPRVAKVSQGGDRQDGR